MKLLFDLLPIILFFGTFKFASSNAEGAAELCNSLFGDGFDAAHAPVICATAVAIIVSVLQICWMLIRGKKIEPMLWISVAVIIVFGGLTIWLRNEMFIKWKPTILYWLFATILIGGWFSGRNFIKHLLGKQITLDENVWTRVMWLWVFFFVLTGIINLIVAYTCPTDIWVDFKLFGLMGLTIAFTLGLGFYIAKNSKEELTKGKEN